MLLRCLTALYLLLVATGPADLQSQPAAANPDPSFIYTVAQVYEPLAWMRGEERFSKGAALFIKNGKSERPLLPQFCIVRGSDSFLRRTTRAVRRQGAPRRSLADLGNLVAGRTSTPDHHQH